MTVSAYPHETWEPTQVSSTVLLAGGPLEVPPPDPGSPLRLDSLRAGPAGAEAVVTLEGCRAGAELYLQVEARPEAGGKRLGGDVAAGWEATTCTGAVETVTVPLDGTLPKRRAVVDVSSYVYDETGFDEHQILVAAPVAGR